MKRLIVIDDLGIEKKISKLLSRIDVSIVFDSETTGNKIVFSALLESLHEERSVKIVIIKSNGNLLSIYLDEIVRIDCVEEGSVVFLQNKQAIHSSENFAELEVKMLDSTLVKINEKMLINLRHIAEVSFSKVLYLTLTDGHHVFLQAQTAQIIEQYFNTQSM